jgi:arginine:ornithine antiporter/lysine permease
MDALNYFFPPYFAGGNGIYSIIGGSLLIWGFNFLVLKGIHEATLVNLIGTVAKIVPLIFFIIVMIVFFHFDKFSFDFWGENEIKLGDLPHQIKGTMLVTLWAFIGIEGAVVMSQHATNPTVVGRATMLGFIGSLLIYVLLSVLPYGVMSQTEIASLPNPSTAALLEPIVGKFGADFMNIGLLLSVLTSWLAWTMVTAQIPQAAAQNGTFPKEFAVESKSHAPIFSLYVTSFVMQLFMLLVYFSDNAWNTMLSITSVMVLPAYLTSALYLWKICEDHEYPLSFYIKRSTALLCGVGGSLYAIWMIYAAGLSYLLMAIIFMALGIPVFMYARHQISPNERIFTQSEKYAVWILILLALFAVYAMTYHIV